MADRLKSPRVPSAFAALRATAWLIFAATSGSVAAETSLADPTRPPVGVSAPAEEGGMASGPVLQSVMIPKRGKPVAIIGGERVALGGLYGESRLVRLSEREAVLEGPEGLESLPLTPGIEKTNIVMNNVKKPLAPGRAQVEGKP